MKWLEKIEECITKAVFSKRIETFEKKVLDDCLGTIEKPKIQILPDELYHQ
jgi:hypothetical protein